MTMLNFPDFLESNKNNGSSNNNHHNFLLCRYAPDGALD